MNNDANVDDELLVPIPPAMRPKVTPEMIVPRHDFGGDIGVLDAIRLHDLLLLSGISDREMREIDTERRKKGLDPMFGDPE
jgi:hypothetical protein